MNKKIKNARITLFVLFGMLLSFTIGNMIYYNVILETDEKQTQQMTRLLLSVELMYLIYIGKHWAKILYSVLLILGIIMSIISIFFVSGSPGFTLVMILISIVYAYTVYFLNANNGFEEFVRYQRKNSDYS